MYLTFVMMILRSLVMLKQKRTYRPTPRGLIMLRLEKDIRVSKHHKCTDQGLQALRSLHGLESAEGVLQHRCHNARLLQSRIRLALLKDLDERPLWQKPRQGRSLRGPPA
jgi:hypothetical protein